VLQSLHEAEQLRLFDRILLYCGKHPLYEGSEPVIRLIDWLHSIGFDVLCKEDDTDPDRPCWILIRNILFLKNSEQERNIQKLRTQLAEANRKVDVLSHRIVDLLTRLDGSKQERYAKARLAEIQQESCKQANAAVAANLRNELQDRTD